MPKVPMYTLAWSATTAAYELSQTRDREVLRIAPNRPGWSRCPPSPSLASAATLPYAKKLNSVVTATGKPYCSMYSCPGWMVFWPFARSSE
jgi:hypothetical protein